MKNYKLYIETLNDVDGGDYLASYSKGHQDFMFFKEVVANEQGCLVSEVYEPQHEWWRWNVQGKHLLQAKGKEGQRGSFPVTVIWY